MEGQSNPEVKKQSHPAVRPLIDITLGIIVLGFGFVYFGYLFAIPHTCEDLLSTTETEALFENHQDAVAVIEKLGGYRVGVEQRVDCAGKAEIIIEHGTFQHAVHIRKELGETFFGAPYRLLNT